MKAEGTAHWRDAGIGVVLLAVVVLAVFESMSWPSPRSRLFPLVICAVLIGLCLILIVKETRAATRGSDDSAAEVASVVDPPVTEVDPGEDEAVWPYLLLLICYGAGCILIGLPAASLILGFVYSRFVVHERWLATVRVLAIVVVFFIGMSLIPGVTLPNGWLGDVLGG